MPISTIEQIQDLVRKGFRDWSQHGHVKAVYHDGLVLLNYTDKAQYEGEWNFFERVSRGLILDEKTGEIVARPFDKFFNWDEQSFQGDIVEVTEKLDGSLGILYRHRGEYRIATRGDFHSEQAIWATEFLKKNFDLTNLPEEYTLLFEIIYPQNRIVVDYGNRHDLVLIGVRNRFTGEDFFYNDVARIAEWFGFSLPQTYHFKRIDEILELAKSVDHNFEGWVVRLSDGTRLKVKGKAYLDVHKVLYNLSFRSVVEKWFAGELDEYLDGIPDEFLKEVKDWVNDLEQTIQEKEQSIRKIVASLPQLNDRKDLAEWIHRNHPEKRHLIFKFIDGHDITPFIIKETYGISVTHLIGKRKNKN